VQIQKPRIQTIGAQTMKLNKNDEQVVAAIKPMGTELTMQEIADKTGLPSKKVFKSLKKLFENELISCQGRKYKLLKEKPTVSATVEPDLPNEESE
jgi:predicted transcriptional regulator